MDNHKIVWGSIKKYRAGINRFKSGTIERVKETVYYGF